MASSDRFSLLIESLSNYCGSWRNFFAGIGLIASGYVTLRSACAIARSINVHVLGARNIRYRLTQYGQWAVITGCTQGVGREFAMLLASYGLDVVLIARDKAKLDQLAQLIENQYGVQTVVVCVDFAQGAGIYGGIKAALSDKEIGILINNVGVMYDYPDYFYNIDEAKLWELVNVNVGAAQAMTHIVLTQSMIPRRRGLIVFMSSLSAYQPIPLVTTYSASKAYVDFLARGLYHECRPLNIHVQNLMPSYVATRMTSYNSLVGQPNILSPSAADYVRHASWTLAMTDRTTGYFPHTVLWWGAQMVPEWCWIRTTTALNLLFRRTAIATIDGQNG